MVARIVAVAFACLVAGFGVRAQTQPAGKTGAFAFQPVAVEFPEVDPPLPPGAGLEVVTNNCTGCHSPGMILTQPKLSEAAWTGEVQKMQHTYKAPVADEDVPAIVAYLVTLPR